MVFHSGTYLLLFLPAAVLVYGAVASRPVLRTPALFLIGTVYYVLSASLPHLMLLLVLTLVAFAGMRGFPARGAASRPGIGLGTALLLLAVLVAFKLSEAWGFGPLVALPLGISFYTFNLVSCSLDVRRGRTASVGSFLPLVAYSTFFPTVAAGPLMRYDEFHPQEVGPRPPEAGLFERGALSLIVGLAKKTLVADPLGVAIEPLFADYERLGLDAWLAVLGYAYQLYFDFSGYTDMAIGSAALLGFRVPPNFNAPYTAIHITDFWQRWHMTMSQWFRDYLFLPLSRALLRRSPSLDGAEGVRALCLVFTMVVIGFWHGATWGFLAWGLYHGLLLAAHARLRTARGLRVPIWASRALTFVVVLAGWVLLRSPSPGMATRIWGAMAGLHGWGVTTLPSRGALMAAVLVLLIVTNSPLERYLLQPRRGRLQSWVLASILVLSLLSMGARSPFLYFQF